MAYYCMTCKQESPDAPCTHCGSNELAFIINLDNPPQVVKLDIDTDKEDIYTLFDSLTVPTFFEMEIKLTPEQAEKWEKMFPKFDVYELVGVPCATCGEPFTDAFFDAGGTMIRTADDRWQHDHCAGMN